MPSVASQEIIEIQKNQIRANGIVFYIYRHLADYTLWWNVATAALLQFIYYIYNKYFKGFVHNFISSVAILRRTTLILWDNGLFPPKRLLQIEIEINFIFMQLNICQRSSRKGNKKYFVYFVCPSGNHVSGNLKDGNIN